VGHPNKGYYLLPGRTQLDYRIENVPLSTQTQVTGLNDNSTQVGFYTPSNNGPGMDINWAWYSLDNGRTFRKLVVPHVTFSNPQVTQLLGVNDEPVSSLTETAISNKGHIAGFFTDSDGIVKSFLKLDSTHIIRFAVPGAAMTQALGVNDSDEVVGTYTVGTGASAVTHGFTWTQHGGFKQVDDPSGMPGTTNINGVDDHGDLVGFYSDSHGNVDGLLTSLK
jgi:hypothetical protein